METLQKRNQSLFVIRNKEVFILLAVLVLDIVIMSWMSPRFLSVRNLLDSTRLGSEIGIIAIGMTLVILLGGIDLSVGSMFAVSAVVMGMCIDAGANTILSVATALISGILMGAVNGGIVSFLNIPPIIATLGTMSLWRGVAMGMSRGRSFPIPEDLYDMIGGQSVVGTPVQFIIFVVLAAGAAFTLSCTTLGRSLIATGNNSVASLFSGIHVTFVKITAYCASGFMSAIAAVLFCCRVTSAKADFGTGYEMDAITIVVLGGASLKGGKANIPGALIGMLIVILTRRGMTMSQVSPDVQTIVFGVLLALAVGINSFADARTAIRR